MRAKAALALTAIILTIVALEIGLRLYLGAYGDERQKTLYLWTREEIAERQSLYRGLSYLNFGLSPAHEQVNALGYRGPEIALPKPDETYRIVAMGGSTTYGAHLESWRDAYPHLLERQLRETFGYGDVEVVNAGVPSYSSWESLVSLALRIPDLAPDMIIVYHALNDVSARLVDPKYYDGLNASRGHWQAREDPLPVSALYRFAVRQLGFDSDAQVGLPEQFRLPAGFQTCGLDTSGGEPRCGNLDMSVDQVLSANPPVYFERNLSNMIHLARAMEVDLVLLTWAYSPLEFDFPGGDVMRMPFSARGGRRA